MSGAVDRRRRVADAELDAADLRVGIADHSQARAPVCASHLSGERAERRLGNRRTGASSGAVSCFASRPIAARRTDVGEVGPLRVHVIVDAEDDDVVLPQEIELRLCTAGRR